MQRVKTTDPLCSWIDCSGEAHRPEIGGMIDNCTQCAPHWGRVAVCISCGGKVDEVTRDGKAYRKRPKCRHCGKYHRVDSDAGERIPTSQILDHARALLVDVAVFMPRASCDDGHMLRQCTEEIATLVARIELLESENS